VLIPARFSAATQAGPDAGAALQTLRGQTMGTSWSASCALQPGADIAALQRCIQQALDEVVSQMSSWDAGSQLCRFNAAPAASWQFLPDAFFEVLACAHSLAQQTQGAYDATIGALVDCWGFGPQAVRETVPSDDEIRAALQRAGWSRLQIDAERRAALQPGGLQLDFSSIAKGYGVDCMAACFEHAGLHHYLCEVGGELRGQGCKPDGSPWWVELEAVPGISVGQSRWRLALDGLAVATSGDYRRYYERGSRRYAHTIDPRNGRPLRAPPAAVTVIHGDCMRADALATALTVLGLQDGMAYAERHDIAALFVIRCSGRPDAVEEFPSSAFMAMLD
jgi:thiamine biosynthesis lipoprotein